jgi:translation initiation factor 2 alpha subunit (eIF-2alpha)
MSVKLDNTRVNRDMNNYVQEIIQHLMSIDGADVEMKLEVQVQAPNGIPSTTVRTVSENCKTLKVDDFGFDD